METRNSSNFLLFFFLYAYAMLVVFIASKIEHSHFVHNYVKVFLYYFLATILVTPLIYRLYLPYMKHFTIIPFLILICFYIGAFYLFKKKKIVVDSVLEKNHHQVVLEIISMDTRFLVSRSANIFFQQTLLTAGYFLLYNSGLTVFTLMWLGAVASLITHWAIVFHVKNERFFKIYFIFVSSGLAFFCPLIIFNVHYGFVYTFILHWIIGYIIFGFMQRYQLRHTYGLIYASYQ